MKSLNILIAAALLASLSTACSSDDKKTSTTTKSACESFCDKQATECADAGINFGTATECKTNECANWGSSAVPAACDSAAQAYYNCELGLANICSDGCANELSKMITDCG